MKHVYLGKGRDLRGTKKDIRVASFMKPQNNTTDSIILKPSTLSLIAFKFDLISQVTKYNYSTLESLLIAACKQTDFENDLETICSFYKDDFDKSLLRTQLQTFAVHFQQCVSEGDSLENVAFFDLMKYFSSLSDAQASLLDQVSKLMQLVLVMPATNASSERSFSALRRLKTYLRSTMLQERLNYLMLLHVHKNRTDGLCIKTAINDFIQDSQHRCNIFAKY